jgi:hypothetical protein
MKKYFTNLTRVRDRPGKTQQTGIKSFIAYIFKSQRARVQESKRENGETLSLFQENYPPPRTCHSLIGCSPLAELSSRGRQSTHGVKNYPWHMHRLFVYHLEHRMSAPSCNGECEGGSPHICFDFFLLFYHCSTCFYPR